MQIIGMEIDFSGHLTLTPEGHYCHLKGPALNILMHSLVCSTLKSLSLLLEQYGMKGYFIFGVCVIERTTQELNLFLEWYPMDEPERLDLLPLIDE